MSFDACESSNLMHFVPFEGLASPEWCGQKCCKLLILNYLSLLFDVRYHKSQYHSFF